MLSTPLRNWPQMICACSTIIVRTTHDFCVPLPLFSMPVAGCQPKPLLPPSESLLNNAATQLCSMKIPSSPGLVGTRLSSPTWCRRSTFLMTDDFRASSFVLNFLRIFPERESNAASLSDGTCPAGALTKLVISPMTHRRTSKTRAYLSRRQDASPTT